MNRFKLYIYLFVLNLMVFLLGLVFKFVDTAGIINLICFVASVLFFLFTVEEPPRAEKLKIPEVHNYYRERQNNYSNYVSIEFALLCFVFFFLSSTPINIGWIVNSLWFISIPITFFIIVQTTKKKEFWNTVDYIRFVEKDISVDLIEKAVALFDGKKTLIKSKLVDIKGFDPALLSVIADSYIHYQKNKDTPLLKGEVEEINSL